MGILKIAYLFDCASYEDVLCMNLGQHDVNWLVVPFSTMNKTSNMMLTLFEKAVVGVLGTGVPRLACLRPAAWLKGGPSTAHLH